MARAVRWFQPGIQFYEVVIKCVGDEMLMRPDPRAVFLIARALAGACLKNKTVQLVAFCFVSNHAHLILMVTGDGRAISDFMKSLDETIAMDLNAHRGRDGHFVKGRPKITPIIDDAHLLQRMSYVHAQPVRHDLVERAEDWPGLSSFRAVCDGKSSVEVAWLDEARWRQYGARRDQISAYTSTISVPLATLPMWRCLSERELRAARHAHERSVRDRERDKAAERAAGGKHRSLGKPWRLTKIDPFSRPTGPRERKPMPWAHGAEVAIKAYRAAYSVMIEVYRVASETFRASGRLCEFPEGTFPPWVRCAEVT